MLDESTRRLSLEARILSHPEYERPVTRATTTCGGSNLLLWGQLPSAHFIQGIEALFMFLP
jgi:hypothetical protein